MNQRILKYSLLNFAGYFLPLLIGFLVIPWLLKNLGNERFGLLALSWAFIGYLTLFDFGLGRAMSQQVAKYVGQSEETKISSLFWNANMTVAGFGIIGTLLALATIPFAISYLPNLNETVRQETSIAVWFVALMIFPTIVSNSLNNFLLALEAFGWLNILRVPLNTLNFIVPVWVVAYPEHQPLGILDTICLYLLIGRILFTLLIFVICVKVWPNILQIKGFQYSWPKQLLKLGGWMTVTNIIGPMMSYLDRFFIAALLSPQAVTLHVIAYELASKLHAIPSAISSALAPTFAKSTAANYQSIRSSILISMLLLSAIFLPILLLTEAYAESLLTWWLGQEGQQTTAEILQWLAAGFYLNAIAMIAYTYVQYIGRPDLTAKFHLIELPIYITILWVCLQHFGIVGAAIAWVARAGIDMILLLIAALHLNQQSKHSLNTLPI